MLTHKGVAGMVECPICKMKVHPRHLTKHKLTHDKERPRFSCIHCGKQFLYPVTLKSHAITHNPHRPKFTCQICDKQLLSKGTLILHLKKTHGNQPRLECNKCGKKLKNMKTLKEHSRTQHEYDKIFKCQMCAVAFTCEARLIRHQARHTTDFRCLDCSKVYKDKHTLKRHILKCHKD